MAKYTVEDSKDLDVLDFARQGYLHDGSSGTIRWLLGDRETGSVSWRVTGGALHLTYTETRLAGGRTDYSYPVPLTYTPATYGGERVWFTCLSCEKRVRKAYLPPWGRYFLCRGCHGLSYESRQTHWSARERALEKLCRLDRELKTLLPLGGRRWLKSYLEIKRLSKMLEGMPFEGMPFEGMPFEELPPLTDDPVKRHPGRPSKRELRERAQAQREAARGTETKRPRGRPKVKRSYTRRTPLTLSERKSDMEGYCMKCRDRREMKDPQPVTLSNGRPALQGTCPVCGTKVTRIVKAG